jgi:cellulose synthase/poly-beta-1,6-N-acetylglucosamine synthase-like glycosyltransferase
VVKGELFTTVVHVHDIGENPDKKVGALNFGYYVSRGYDYILGVDGDTTLDRRCLEWLEKEMVTDPRIGGLSAIYTFDKSRVKGRHGDVPRRRPAAQFAGSTWTTWCAAGTWPSSAGSAACSASARWRP